jgi:hypothetical protein
MNRECGVQANVKAFSENSYAITRKIPHANNRTWPATAKIANVALRAK